MLHRPLALDGRANILVALDPDQAFQAVAFGEPLGSALPMFPDARTRLLVTPT